MRKLKDDRGYTLIEVVVASAVFLIVVLAISGLMLGSFRSFTSAGSRSKATHNTQEEMELAIFDPEYTTEEIQRVDYDMFIFETTISGSLITLEKQYADRPGANVTFVTFIPDDVPAFIDE